MKTSLYFMYTCSKVNSALWYLCYKTPLRIEKKSPRIEFSLTLPRSCLKEILPVTCLWYHSWFFWWKIFLSALISTTKEGWVAFCFFLWEGVVSSIVALPQPLRLCTFAHLNQVYYIKHFKTLKWKRLCKCKIYSLTTSWWRSTSELALLKGFFCSK